MHFPTRRALVILTLCLSSSSLFSQTVGIGTDFPTATLDIRTTTAISSLNVNRNLAGSAGSNPAIKITDASDFRVMDLTQSRTTNTQEVVRLTQSGVGEGLYIAMSNASSAQEGLKIGQTGLGDALFLYQTNASGSNDALQIYNYGDNQKGIRVDNRGYSAWGLLNLMDDGTAVYNVFSLDDGISVFTDMNNKDGAGYFFTNIDLATYYGTGSVVGNGDGFALDVFMSTTSPSVGSTVYGAVIGGEQFGLGHGMLINHSGTNGRNAEFNISDPANTDVTIFATNSGKGPVITAQQMNSAVGANVAVATFNYIGTESRDHKAVTGYSAPASGLGYGAQFTGGKYGIVGQEATGAAISGVHAVGDVSATGLKPFIIDHPLDPEDRYLRHFAMESNEVLNVYRGVAQVARNGRAVVQLPDYFDAVNVNVSYQLTPVGSRQQPWVEQEVTGNRFEIGGAPGSKVSWTIYANRNDAYVRAHPDKLRDEFDKDAADKGRYMDPFSHRQPASKGIFYHEVEVLQPMHRAKSESAVRQFAKGQEAQREVKSLGHALDAGRETAPPSFQPMPIHQEIKTWDELR